MTTNEKPEILLFSDGGADPNPGKGGFGIILQYGKYEKEFSKGYKRTTNNRMEIRGVIYGLEQLKKTAKVKVYTDSRYVVDTITKGWAEKWKSKNWYRTKKAKAKNSDLWKRMLELLEKHEVEFHWVKGHNGHKENERCDELATKALNSKDLEEDIGFMDNETNITSNAKGLFD